MQQSGGEELRGDDYDYVSQCVYQRVDVKIKYEHKAKANMKSLVGDETDETLLKSLL